MATAEERFDAFYRSTRAGLLQQAFALTGDVRAATFAVREAYVEAWQNWRKVSALPDPEAWVRPRAWSLAQRRHTARIGRRSKGVADENKAVLDAVAKLPGTQRKLLLLTALAGLPVDDAAREVGVTAQAAQRSVEAGQTRVAAQLRTAAAALPVRLRALDQELGGAFLPRPTIVRRAGRKRRQTHTLMAVFLTVVAAVGAGAVAYQPSAGRAQALHLIRPPAQSAVHTADGEPLPTADQLLDADQVQRLGMRQTWSVGGTSNNTSGDGINTICQQSRFADPAGLSAIVRTFQAHGKPPRTAVQTVEISKSVPQAKRTFHTTVGWYAGCQLGRLQVLRAYRVDHIGDQATVLMLRVWDQPVTTYSVAVARIGAVTTSTVGKTVGGTPPPPSEIAQSLADSVSMLCSRSGSSGCAKVPSFTQVPPPATGEEPGILATGDLPPVGNLNRPWVGTTPAPAQTNPAATTCDKADFAGSGATATRTRTYLIPQAKLPARFGLSETYGVYGSEAQASSFLAQIRKNVAGCEHRDLATKVTGARHGGSASGPVEWSTWDLSTEVTNSAKVRFRVGFIRVGRTVAQLTFASVPHEDMSAPHFRELVQRAGDRLLELGKG
jgi:DNA-directed RNA polymerase specialized sigma24 family protein